MLTLYGVWGTDASKVWAMGFGGLILKWDRMAWRPQFCGGENGSRMHRSSLDDRHSQNLRSALPSANLTPVRLCRAAAPVQDPKCNEGEPATRFGNFGILAQGDRLPLGRIAAVSVRPIDLVTCPFTLSRLAPGQVAAKAGSNRYRPSLPPCPKPWDTGCPHLVPIRSAPLSVRPFTVAERLAKL